MTAAPATPPQEIGIPAWLATERRARSFKGGSGRMAARCLEWMAADDQERRELRLVSGWWGNRPRVLTLGQLGNLARCEVRSYPNVGPAVLSEIEASLARAGVPVRWDELPRANNPRDILTTEWRKRDRQTPTRATVPFYVLADECPTLGDLADIPVWRLLTLKNFGRKSIEPLAESLRRAGVETEWSTRSGEPRSTLEAAARDVAECYEAGEPIAQPMAALRATLDRMGLKKAASK